MTVLVKESVCNDVKAAAACLAGRLLLCLMMSGLRDHHLAATG